MASEMEAARDRLIDVMTRSCRALIRGGFLVRGPIDDPLRIIALQRAMEREKPPEGSEPSAPGPGPA